jgi:hypothetical protein
MLDEALKSTRYWGDAERVAELKKKIRIPISEEDSYNRCYRNARLDLVNSAAEKADEAGEKIVLPNEETIHTEALARYRKNREADVKKAERKAKNKPQAQA